MAKLKRVEYVYRKISGDVGGAGEETYGTDFAYVENLTSFKKQDFVIKILKSERVKTPSTDRVINVIAKACDSFKDNGSLDLQELYEDLFGPIPPPFVP